MALRLPRIPSGLRIINPDGTATNTFKQWQDDYASRIEASVNAVELALEAAGIALDAAAAAQAAADDAIAANETITNDQSLINSGVVNEVGGFSANAAGVVTVPNHQRLYGDSTLNPTVSVTGAAVATGALAGDLIYIYYDDPTRSGGAVTYQFTSDVENAVQGGDRHSVGVVEIPPSGIMGGRLTRPPGIPS